MDDSTTYPGARATEGDAGFALTLGHVLGAAGIAPADFLVLRHTFANDDLGGAALRDREHVRRYTSEQPVGNKVPADAPPWWLVLVKEDGRRCRLYDVYRNHGLLDDGAVSGQRRFDLRLSPALSTLVGRLCVEWSADTINWAKRGSSAQHLTVVELADPERVPFPGYDRVLIDFDTLQEVVTHPRYEQWRAALAAVQGVYLIADRDTGGLYVGKADGRERILGRWATYAADGHGGNVALREGIRIDPERPRRYQLSLLRVFGPQVPQVELDAAESHYKAALCTRTGAGLNRN